MVFLRDELVLENELIREVSNKLRQLASLEFAIIFHKHKHRLDPIRHFGDEIEYIIVNLNHKLKLPQLLPIYPHIQSFIQFNSSVTVTGPTVSTGTNTSTLVPGTTESTGTPNTTNTHTNPLTTTNTNTNKDTNSTTTNRANSTYGPTVIKGPLGTRFESQSTNPTTTNSTNEGDDSVVSGVTDDTKVDSGVSGVGGVGCCGPDTVTEDIDWKKCIFTPEYGSYMVESIPDEPYVLSSNYIKDIRESIKERRRRLNVILLKLGFPNAKVTTLTNFIRIGCHDCVYLGDEQFRQPLTGELDYKLSNFFPNICITPFSRFTEISHNIKLKNNSNILIPKFNTNNLQLHTTNGSYHYLLLSTPIYS